MIVDTVEMTPQTTIKPRGSFDFNTLGRIARQYPIPIFALLGLIIVLYFSSVSLRPLLLAGSGTARSS